jgi:hypothetical protein
MDSRPPFQSYYDRAVSKYKPENRQRCSTCGLLAKAITPTDDAEIRSVERDTGIDVYGKVPVSFFCYVNAQPIRQEWAELTEAGKSQQDATVAVFQKDRQCDDWYPYRPGASPLWHYEDMRMMYLEAERRRHDEALEGQRREFQAALAGQRNEFESDRANRDKAENRRVNRLATTLTVAIGITGILVAAIVGAVQIWLAAHAPAVVVHLASPTP